MNMFGRNAGELSALDKMSNALLMGRHMHGAVGHSGHMHWGEAIPAGPISSARVAPDVIEIARNANASGVTIFGILVTDEMVFWMLMMNLIFMSFVVFFMFLSNIDALPNCWPFAPRVRRGEDGYENLDSDDADFIKEVKVVSGGGKVNGGGENGTNTTINPEHEKLIPAKTGDAA